MVASIRAGAPGIAAVALGVVLSACGGSQDGAVSDVAAEFYESVAAGDGEAACALLVPSTRRELEQSSGKRCPAAILEEKIPDVAGDAELAVFDTMAQVRYAADTAFLARMPEGWRVLATACRPQPVGPHDCQVKGG